MISASKKNIIITIIFVLSFFLIQTIFIQGYKSATSEQKNKLLLNFYTRIINRSAAVFTDIEDDEDYYSNISQIFIGNVLSVGKKSSSTTSQTDYTPVTSKPLNTAIKKIDMPDEPVVLIYHTHATESYAATESTPVVYSSYARSKNASTNMVAIGDIVCQILEKNYGIKTIHDTALHDSASYTQSYNNSLNSINKYMKEYPSIQYVFDLHRDGLNDTESARNKYKVTINNLTSTKIMIVVGMNHENSNKNAEFAKTFKSTMDKLYPGVMLPITYRQTSRFNQFTCPNALLFEIGSNLSTFEEARVSAEYLARSIAEVIYNDMKSKN